MEMTHEEYMELALQEAEKAVAQGEVPIGAVIVRDGALVLAGGRPRGTLYAGPPTWTICTWPVAA